MKNHIILITAIVLVFCAVGCVADAESNILDSGLKEQNSLQKIQITATAADNAPDTKTARIGQDFYWSPGDQISLFYGPGDNGGSQFTSTNTEYATRTIFEGMINVFTGLTEESDAIKFWGIFPYDENSSCVDGGASVITTVQANQETAHNSWGNTQSVCLGRSKGLAMSFYNLCGGIKFCISQEGINKITFRGNGNQTLAGQVKVSMDNDNHPVIDQFMGDAKEITLTTEGNFTPIIGTDTTWYFLIVPPTTFENGFTFTLTKENGQTATKEVTASRTVSRNAFGVMRTPLDKDLEFVTDGVIEFADDAVKAICVANWDTNNDGELSYAEAAAVTSIYSPNTPGGPGSFFSSQDISSFDEFQYFISVTSVPEQAFAGCVKLTGITIPSSVTRLEYGSFIRCEQLNRVTILDDSRLNSIEKYSFIYCKSLTTIVLPAELNIIGEGAFRSSGLTSISIPACVTRIGDDAFYECSDLESVSFPENSSLTSIGNSSFIRSGITSIVVPANVVEIGASAFSECEKLKTVSFADGSALTSIKYGLFIYCSKLKSIIIPEGVTSISEYAFFGCSDLTSVTIPSSVTDIGAFSFYNCANLNSVSVIGESTLASIGENAFNCCGELLSINISDCVTSIGDYAFGQCVKLDGVSIPSSLTYLGEGAFWYCKELTGNIIIPDGVTTIKDHTFDSCERIRSVVIPPDVTSIGESAFLNCKGLTNVTIPAYVETIGQGAFMYCSGLDAIRICAITPPNIMENAFVGTANVPIYVPAGSVEAYKSAQNWSEYANRIQALPE